MNITLFSMNKKTWATISIISLGILYFNLLWKTTKNIDILTTDLLFYSAICALLWRRKNTLIASGSAISSCLGLTLLTISIVKITTLYSFEATLIPLLPFIAAISLALISSGTRGLAQFKKEIFFAWFLFFPTGVIGHFIDNLVEITVLNAKFATYILYYVGFDVANYGNQVILDLPKLGQYKAVVDYPCAGVPMILLMLKLSLLLVCFFPFSKTQKTIIPLVSVAIGFVLGVIRVCILTLLIPEPAKFDYWHGSSGDGIFSTLAIMIFAGFAYFMLEKVNSLDSDRQKTVSDKQLLAKHPADTSDIF